MLVLIILSIFKSGGKRMASELPGVSVWTSYVGLSLAEQVLARQNFGENVRNILYNFRGMKAIECDNDGRVVDIVA